MPKELLANVTLSHFGILSKLGQVEWVKSISHRTSELGRAVALKILAAEVAKE